MEKNNWVILSLGGSIVVPESIDENYLLKFKDFILKFVKNGKKFIIFVGGGKTARLYQAAAKNLGVSNESVLDSIGIYSTHLNASLVLSLFNGKSFPGVIKDRTNRIKTGKKIIIAGGWKPGCSTDYDAVLMTKDYGAKKVINLSNIDYVYDKNPKEFNDAKPIKKISFSDFLKITGKIWKPGLNLPFDPIATMLAQKEGIEITIANGHNLENLEKILTGKDFQGTVIN